MSNVISLDDRMESRLTDQQRYCWERGADVHVSFRSGVYYGALSSTGKCHFQMIRSLLELIDRNFGDGFSGSVSSVFYDDKNDMGHSIFIEEGFLLSQGMGPVSGYVELEGWDYVVPVDFISWTSRDE